MIKCGRPGWIEGIPSFGIGEMRDQTRKQSRETKGKEQLDPPEQELCCGDVSDAHPCEDPGDTASSGTCWLSPTGSLWGVCHTAAAQAGISELLLVCMALPLHKPIPGCTHRVRSTWRSLEQQHPPHSFVPAPFAPKEPNFELSQRH